MDLSKLNSKDTAVVRDYVARKFKRFNRFTYSRATRIKKCEQYYMAAEGLKANQDIIVTVYWQVFKQVLNTVAANQRANDNAKKKPEHVKIAAGDWLQAQNDQAESVEAMLAKLNRWRDSQDYQLGESFFAKLQELVEDFDGSLMNTCDFQTEFSQQCRAGISHEVVLTKQEIAAQYDLMVGFEQSTAVRFTASNVNWGEVNAKLEQSFKAGLWSTGEAKATMSKLGFSAEVQAAIAMGAQLDIEGQLKWTKGKGELALGGRGSVFVGAQASGAIKLSASASKGLELAIQGGAFAGFSAEVTGSCSFSYDNRTIVTASATAGITFGVGADFNASIKAPIFGPTSIEFGASLTLGLGTKLETNVEIDFDAAALASSAAFKQMVYWRTMARGYEMTLMNSDARNLFYLNKVIARLEADRDGLEETITSYHEQPEEKRSLLMSVS